MKTRIGAVVAIVVMLAGCEQAPPVPYDRELAIDHGMLQVGNNLYLKKIEITQPDEVGYSSNDRVYVLVNKDSQLYNKLTPIANCRPVQHGKVYINHCETVIDDTNGTDVVKTPDIIKE